MVTGIETVSQPKQAGVITSTMATNSVITGGPVGSVESTVPPRRTNENRRSNKPIMEKRRRARINNCLNELKTLILDAMKKDPARHSKLEKADILEMTVKHLENLQRQQAAMTAAADPAVVNKFRAGFSECAGEVGRFSGLEPTVKRRLLQHLANCLAGTINNTAVSSTTGGNINNNKPTESATTTTTTQVTTAPSVQVHILPSPATNTDGQIHLVQQNGIYFTNGNGTGVQLVPTRLPNGDIALVLPTQPTATIYRQQSVVQHSPSSNNTASSTTSTSPLPLLIPIPSRTASTASAASSTSATSSGSSSSMTFNAPSSGRDSAPSPQPSQCYSVPGSPTHGCELMDIHPSPSYSPPLQKPLSLVIRKAPVEENPWWRPW